MDATSAAVAAAAAFALAAVLTFVLRRPKLGVEASLRGGTREGKLYVTLHNRGATTARGVRLRVGWRAGASQAWTAERALDALPAFDVARLEVSELHRGLVDAPVALVVEARARNALPARCDLAIQPRAATEAADEPVRYDRAAAERCPARPDGRHALEQRAFFSDGVQERWEVCPACRYARRLPLTPAEEETQRRVREERSRREQAKLEAEWARQAAEEDAARRRRERARRAPPRDRDGELPTSVAFWVLGLDPETATWSDAQAAHRQLALRYHPDRAPGADPRLRQVHEEKMREINAARDALREHFRDLEPQRA